MCVVHIEVLKQAIVIVARVEIRGHNSRLTLCCWIKLIHSLPYGLGVKTMSQGYCMSNIRVFGLPVHEKKIFQNPPNVTPFCPLLGANRCQPLDFHKLESPFPKDTSYQFGSNQFSGFGEAV